MPYGGATARCERNKVRGIEHCIEVLAPIPTKNTESQPNGTRTHSASRTVQSISAFVVNFELASEWAKLVSIATGDFAVANRCASLVMGCSRGPSPPFNCRLAAAHLPFSAEFCCLRSMSGNLACELFC